MNNRIVLPSLDVIIVDSDAESVRGGDALAYLAQSIERTEAEYLAIVANGTITAAETDRFLQAIAAHPGVDVLYADEAVVAGDHIEIVSKPDFSPERLRGQFYFGSVIVYRTALVREVGGLRSELDGAALYDLCLRATRRAAEVVHVPEVLSRSKLPPSFGRSEPEALDHIRRALDDHLTASGGGVVEHVSESGVHRTARSVQGTPLVSIVIPTRGIWSVSGSVRHSLILDAVRSIIETSTYSNLEIVVVYDSVADVEILDSLREVARDALVLVEWTESFNFSSKINLGVVRSTGEFLLILNDDVKVITPEWIERLLALSQRPGAGMVGCMLYYDDETIQHAGHHYWQGDAKHIGMFVPRGDPGPLSGYLVEREVSGVTAACAMMPREVYFAVGGMSSLLPGAFNDVDLCMKVTAAGYAIYWTPYAELYHYESKTRDASVQKYEVDTAWGRWGSRMHDPRYWPYPV